MPEYDSRTPWSRAFSRLPIQQIHTDTPHSFHHADEAEQGNSAQAAHRRQSLNNAGWLTDCFQDSLPRPFRLTGRRESSFHGAVLFQKAERGNSSSEKKHSVEQKNTSLLLSLSRTPLRYKTAKHNTFACPNNIRGGRFCSITSFPARTYFSGRRLFLKKFFYFQ